MIIVLLVSQALGDWRGWGSDLSHQSLQIMRGAIGSSPVVKWGFATQSSVESQFSAIADVNGDGSLEVVIASVDGNIYCFRGSDGGVIWNYTMGAASESSPAVADVNGDGQLEIVVGSENGNLYCVRGSDGSLVWSYNETTYAIKTSPSIADVNGDGQLEVLMAFNGAVYCLKGSDGSLVWKYIVGLSSMKSSPAIADVDGDGSLEVLVGAGNGNVYCLNGQDGSMVWSYHTGDEVVSSPAIADVDGDGTVEVIVGSCDYNVYCLNGQDGSMVWSYSTKSEVWASPAIADVDRDGSLDVVIGSRDHNVYCLDGATGQEKWSYDTGKEIRNPGSLADVDGDGKLEFLVPNNGGTVFRCLNAEDGSLLWERTLAYDIHSPFTGDIDGDDCMEIITGTLNPDPDGYYLFALDDTGDSSGCGFLYENVDETPKAQGLEFRSMGKDIYLFAPEFTRASLCLYDASGRLTQTLFDGVLTPGTHIFSPKLETNGLYLAMLATGNSEKTIKVIR